MKTCKKCKLEKRNYHFPYNKPTFNKKGVYANICSQCNRKGIIENPLLRKNSVENKLHIDYTDITISLFGSMFINKLEKRGGYCDELEAWVLTSVFLDTFDKPIDSEMFEDLEDELSFYYTSLKKINK